MSINHNRLEQRREQIIQAALGCFIERGFHQTGMRDIATAAGVSLGNLYNHFARKEELIALIASLEAAELQPLLDELTRGPARAALARFAAGYLAWSMSPENLLLGTEILAELTRHPEMAATFASNQRQLCDALANTVRRGQQEGCRDRPCAMHLLSIQISPPRRNDCHSCWTCCWGRPTDRPKESPS
ncbi:TetR/AcrR family transcriptional regulator [Aeromonas sp.]|uniref:TetR/AcrR family transcriptional regulator n=1 Tax=Aeromonas sp. TaxID=647 RepID=UPI002582FF33|nr:TetR/AcrR family transcriptional regulator [Aeromonas sp.]MCX7134015.1 TetR/AcrR family transcriptional regulator [Aeromonas sp.]